MPQKLQLGQARLQAAWLRLHHAMQLHGAVQQVADPFLGYIDCARRRSGVTNQATPQRAGTPGAACRTPRASPAVAWARQCRTAQLHMHRAMQLHGAIDHAAVGLAI